MALLGTKLQLRFLLSGSVPGESFGVRTQPFSGISPERGLNVFDSHTDMLNLMGYGPLLKSDAELSQMIDAVIWSPDAGKSKAESLPINPWSPRTIKKVIVHDTKNGKLAGFTVGIDPSKTTKIHDETEGPDDYDERDWE